MSDASAALIPAVRAHPEGEADGWYGWIASLDHKQIGIVYLIAGVVFFAVGGLEALLLRTQLRFDARFGSVHEAASAKDAVEQANEHPGVTAVVHGHAHKGSLDGHTSTNIPVYNVALPLMRRTSPDQPFRIIDI